MLKEISIFIDQLALTSIAVGLVIMAVFLVALPFLPTTPPELAAKMSPEQLQIYCSQDYVLGGVNRLPWGCEEGVDFPINFIFFIFIGGTVYILKHIPNMVKEEENGHLPETA